MALFICVEGIDGSGKSTFIKTLERALKTQGQSCVITREPGGTLIAEKIRGLFISHFNEINAQTQMLMLTASRSDHLMQVVNSQLHQGKHVLCDRYLMSTYVYQVFNPSETTDSFNHRLKIFKDCLSILTCDPQLQVIPDITFYLRIDPQLAVRRTTGRKENNAIDQKSIEYFKRLENGYESLVDLHQDAQFLTQNLYPIEADQSIEAMVEQALNYIQPHLTPNVTQEDFVSSLS